jgi:predicted MFS family arabinose efflux permease
VLLAGAVLALNVGVNLHMAINVPYINEVLRATPWQQGYLESIRESCGIMSVIVITLLVGFSEPRLGAVMLLLTGGGLAAYWGLGSIPHLILASLVWSFGFHMWAPLSRSMSLALARPGREGEFLGKLRSVGTLGILIALGGVYLLKRVAGMGMRELFLIGGGVTLLGALPLLLMPHIRSGARRSGGGSRGRMPLRKALAPGYRLYCGIELLDGMRRQVFLLFANLYLVRERGVEFHEIAGLLLVSQVLCMAVAPVAGRLVDRFGERPVLTGYFASIGVVFVLYATVTNIHVLYAIYVVDHTLFVMKVAAPTYANRVAQPAERTQLLAMGVTMNHVGAVTLPLLGGALYYQWDYRLPFLCGIAIAVVSVVVARFVPPRPAAGQEAGGLEQGEGTPA